MLAIHLQLSPLFYETGSPTEPEAWWVDSRSACLGHPVLDTEVVDLYITESSFCVGAGDPNSVPHVHTASTNSPGHLHCWNSTHSNGKI